MTEADYVCQRLYSGIAVAGDGIRMISLNLRGIEPDFFDYDFTTMKVTVKNK